MKISSDYKIENFWLKDLQCPLNPISNEVGSPDVESVYACEKAGWLNEAESFSCRSVGGFTCFEEGMTGNL